MRLILAVSFFFASSAFATTPAHIGSDLERLLGNPISQSQLDLIRTTIPETTRLERFAYENAMNDLRSKLTSNTEARVCVTRCSGTGENKVCWEVCVDNND